MDCSQEKCNPNPREKANPISTLFYTYTYGMFYKGCKKALEIDDLYSPLSSDKSHVLGNKLERKWKRHLHQAKQMNKPPSLLKVLLQSFWREYAILGVLLFILYFVARILPPIMLGKLLRYFQPDSNMSKNEAFLYAGILVVANIAIALFSNNYLFGSAHYGMRIRIACSSLIYRKALKLSRAALGETATGTIINLLSSDVSRFESATECVHHMWLAPISTCIVMYILWGVAGVAGVIGVLPVLVVVPLQSYAGRLSCRFRLQTALRTDERIRLMDEIIMGIQVIKMYAWEKPIEKLLKISRMNELKVLIKSTYIRGIFMTFKMCTGRLALFCALLTIYFKGDKITASTVFVFMSFFEYVAHNMSTMFVLGIFEMSEVRVAIKRVEQFLLSDEFETNKGDKPKMEVAKNVAVYMQNVTSKWGSDKNALKNVHLCVNKGKLVGVIGPVGSGKSSLLMTLLGELEVAGGDVIVNGRLSYAPQEPWVFAATVRQNILFGQQYDKFRYQRVVNACALKKDFEQFDKGDLTQVGDRGASLSGGQKARISLARAIYREADVYLLDDPLSAVDTNVAKHLYRECINGFLLNKTRILVTHQVHHLSTADNMIIMKDGCIEAEGNFRSLAQNNDALYANLLMINQTSIPEDRPLEKHPLLRRQSAQCRSVSRASIYSIESATVEDFEYITRELLEISNMQEDSSRGKVKGSIFLKYFCAGRSYCLVAIVVTLLLVTQLAASTVDFFVSFWTNLEEHRNAPTASLVAQDLPTESCLYIYGSLIAGLFTLALTRSLLYAKLAMINSEKLHNNMFHSVLHTTMQFFNANSSGRILNRFSKDMDAIDELLPRLVLDSAQIMLMLCSRAILVTILNPLLLIPLGVLVVIYYAFLVVYLKSSNNLKRLEGITRSPVFSHLNGSMQGLSTIRAFGAQHILTEEFDDYQDTNTSSSFMYISASMAFSLYLDMMCSLFVGMVTFSFLTFGETIFSGNVGLAISQATALSGSVQFGMRQSAEASNHLISVERVLEYWALPAERNPRITKNPGPDWPDRGKIRFRDVGLSYASDTPLILRNINMTIEAKDKVGIVGRTGAGKSSIISAIIKLADVEGSIEIDDVATEVMNLELLRSKISIISQDPVLFSGTLRYNLDPFEKYSDDVLWKALEEVGLKDSVHLTNMLDTKVMDRGVNFSVGQRQLICLARAIVRNNKILILDEATANVDQQTDELIQKTIRQNFGSCTVLTIAHRLNTIVDSDKLAVMDNGCVVEFDHPHLLLEKSGGIFNRMVDSAGPSVSASIRTTARKCYEEKFAIQ